MRGSRCACEGRPILTETAVAVDRPDPTRVTTDGSMPKLSVADVMLFSGLTTSSIATGVLAGPWWGALLAGIVVFLLGIVRSVVE